MEGNAVLTPPVLNNSKLLGVAVLFLLVGLLDC